ncbi:MAG: hypothetical protein AAGN82_27970 [Myxococcota bacterium]
MTTTHWIAAGAAAALFVGSFISILMRSSYLRMHLRLFAGTAATGAVFMLAVLALEGAIEGWAEIDLRTGRGGTITLLLYSALIAAPLQMALCTLAVWPFWRMRRLQMRAGMSRRLEIREGLAFAASAACGFALVRSGSHLFASAAEGTGGGWLVIRASLWPPVFTTLCCGWGYVLGRHATRGMRGRRFSSAWLGTVVMSAVADQLVFRRGPVALLALVPLALFASGFAIVVWRDLQAGTGGSSGGRISSMLASAPAPSLEAIREAFRRRDRPIEIRWIAFGTFVTTGVITAGLIAAVWLGHEFGLDFAAVDADETGMSAMAPVAWLGMSVLVAFPVSGYLLARASGTSSVLEPAVASSLAMVLVMVLLGMMAPVAVVFVVAFAPIGFALACFGAWVGMEG